MTDPLRRAGVGRLPDGSTVTWSVAEGARGRRWRWVVSTGQGIRHVALLEVDRGGRFARLELESLAGMLTLHPDVAGHAAHGNVVRTGGVDPISIGWAAGDAIAIETDPFGTAVAGWRGRGWVVRADLRVSNVGTGVVPALEVDSRGVPRLVEPAEWPLES